MPGHLGSIFYNPITFSCLFRNKDLPEETRFEHGTQELPPLIRRGGGAPVPRAI